MIQFLWRSGDLRPASDPYFLSAVTKRKEELSCHSLKKLLDNSSCVLKIFFFFIVTGKSKVDGPNKGSQWSKHVINVFTAKRLIYSGANTTSQMRFPLRKSVLSKGENSPDKAMSLHLFSAKPWEVFIYRNHYDTWQSSVTNVPCFMQITQSVSHKSFSFVCLMLCQTGPLKILF